MHCLELIKFDVSNTRHCVEIEMVHCCDDALWSQKMILRGPRNSWEIFREKVWGPCITHLFYDRYARSWTGLRLVR